MVEQTTIPKQKFAIIGTSSAGKSTLTYELMGKLKRLGILAEGVFQQDRRLCFDREKLETEIMAQYNVIFNMVCRETEMLLRDGTDMILSDRSVLDFYAYMEHQYGRIDHVWQFIVEWCKTYDALYYLEPLKYHDDGSRPPEEFRDKVDSVLKRLCVELGDEHGVTVFYLNREDIYKHLLSKIKRILSEEELKMFGCVLGRDCLIGGSYAFNRATKASDVDVYILGNDFEDRPDLAKRLRGVYGVNIEVRTITKEVWDYYIAGDFRLCRTYSLTT